MKFVFLMFFSTCIALFSQQITVKKLVTNPSFQIENLKVVANFSIENSSQQVKFLTVSGILVTDSLWQKQNIDIEIKNTVWRDHSNIVYQKIETLPSSKKSFSIYLKPLEGAYTAKIHFKMANTIIYEGEFSFSRDGLVFCVMYVSPKNYTSNINYLLPVMNEAISEKFKQNSWQQPTVQICHILPEDLPTSWQGYTSTDLVIINSDRPFLDIDGSTNKKSQALLSWLYMGGKIIISSGSSLWPSNNNFMKILFDTDNVNVTSTDTTVSHFPAKNNYVFSHPQKSRKYQDVYWHMPRGYGEIVYLGADIAKYGAAKETKSFWKDHIEIRKAEDLLYNDQKVDLRSRDFTKDRAPILWLISVFVLFYLIIVGPVNFSFFRKRGKTIYLVISIPLIAIVFSIFLLFYGFASKGVTNYAKKLSFIYPLEDNMCYSKDCLVISSGSRSLYHIKGTENTAVSIFNEEDSNSTVSYEQNQEAISIVNYPLNLWELGFFFSDTVQQDFLFSISRNTDKFDCKIDENIKILQAYLITDNALYEISNIKNDVLDVGRAIETRNIAKSIASKLEKDLPYYISRIVSVQITKFLSKNRGKDVVIAFLDKEVVSLEVSPNVTVDREVHVLMGNIKNGK